MTGFGEGRPERRRVLVLLSALALAVAIEGCGPAAVSPGSADRTGPAVANGPASVTPPEPTPSIGCGPQPIYATVGAFRRGAAIELACTAEPALQGTWPVSAKRAADAVRAFLGQSGAMAVYGPYQRQEGQLWSVVASGATGLVDAVSGDLVGVWYDTRYSDDTPATLTEAQARRAAAAYLAEHRVAAAGLTAHVEPSYGGSYAVRWERTLNGVAVTPRISVVVDWASGTVRSYAADRRPFTPPPAARVTRDQAIEKARAEAGSLELKWAELEVDRGADGRSQVFRWRIVLSAPSEGGGANWYRVVGVDAVTGAAERIG